MRNTKGERFRVPTEQSQGLSSEINLMKVGVNMSGVFAYDSLYFSLHLKGCMTAKSCKEANRNGN